MLKLIALNKLGKFKKDPVPELASRIETNLSIVMNDSRAGLKIPEKDRIYSKPHAEHKTWGNHKYSGILNS